MSRGCWRRQDAAGHSQRWRWRHTGVTGPSHQLSLQAVERLFEVSGAHALYDSEPLQRMHRDAIAASHRDGVILDFAGLPYGRLALGLDPAPDTRR